MPEGPAKGETRAAEFAFVTHHRTAHGLRNRVDDGQPESAAARGPVAAGIETNKRFKTCARASGGMPGPSSSTISIA